MSSSISALEMGERVRARWTGRSEAEKPGRRVMRSYTTGSCRRIFPDGGRKQAIREDDAKRHVWRGVKGNQKTS